MGINLTTMKMGLSFLRDTLIGGILFLIPMVLITVVLRKAILILSKVSAPLSDRMPDVIAGLDGSRFLAVCLIVVICFVSGLAFRLSLIRQSVGGLEDKVLSYLPGYTMIKAIVTDTLGSKGAHNMTPVLVRDGDSWIMGFLVEEDGDLCTVFIPDAPRLDSGDVKIVASGCIRKVNVTSNKAARSLQRYGKGASRWLKNT